MSKYCRFCGSPVMENAKYCAVCGRAQAAADIQEPAAEQPEQSGQALPESVAAQAENAVQQAERFVQDLVMQDGQSRIEAVLTPRTEVLSSVTENIKNPFGALLGGARSMITGLFRLNQNKKALILSAVLALLWIVLGHLNIKGKAGAVTDVLSWLTYARGGLSGGTAGLIGGCMGKATVGAGFFAILFGGGPKIISGCKRLLNGKSINFGSMLTGFGLAGIAYAFMAGIAGRYGSMVGICGALLSFRAVTEKTGFLSSFAASFSAKKGADGAKSVVPARYQGILTGAAAGFAAFALLSGLLSLHMTGWLWYIVLSAAVIAGIVLSRTGTKTAVRMLALLGAMCVSLWHILLVTAVPVSAEESGYWKLVNQWEEEKIHTPEREGLSYTDEGSAAAGFHTRKVITGHGMRGPYSDSPGQKGHKDCNGEFGDQMITFSELPAAQLQAGETVAINAQVTCATSDHMLEPGGYVYIRLHWDLAANRFAYFSDENSEWDDKSIIKPLPEQRGDQAALVGDFSGTFSKEIPAGDTGSHSRLYIVFGLNGNYKFIDSIYEYEWVDTTQTEPVAAVTETETTAAESTSSMTTTTVTIIQTVNQDAKDESGLDGGVGVITEIITGVTGTILGAAAIGAVASGSQSGDDKKKQKSAYKMVIYKSFGDGIRRCASPVRVYAAIVEIDYEGDELQRDDLTEKITVSSEDMVARDAGMENGYRAAAVSVPQNYRNETGTLTFMFKGEGGIFCNNIKFRIVDEPKIMFDARDTENGEVAAAGYEVTLPMIAGMGGSDQLRFVIVDATEEPKAIRFRDHEGLTITCRKDLQRAFTYYACVENHSEPIEKENGIFAAGRTIRVTTEAVFEDGMVISEVFSVELYPDGLSVLAGEDDMQNGRLLVNTETDERKKDGSGNATIPSTDYSITVAYLNSEGEAVILEEPAVKHGQPDDGGRYGLMFSDNFRFDIRNRGSSGYAFYPLVTLPMLDEPYFADVPLDFHAEDAEFHAKLPLALTGMSPARQISDAEKEKAIARLKHTIKVFGISDETAIMVRNPQQHSAAELEIIRTQIIIAAVKFEKESKEATERFDKLCSSYLVIAGVLVKCGDEAVRVLMNRLLPVGGDTAAAIINPFKNLFATYIGEYRANGNLDNAPYFWDVALKTVQEIVEGVITGKEKPTPDKLGYVISVYLMVSFVRHYNYDKDLKVRGDVYRSVLAAGCDLTYAKIKEWFSEWMEKASEKLLKALGDFCGSIFKKMSAGRMQEAINQAGSNAFGSVMRDASKNGGISKGALTAARWARGAAKSEELHFQLDLQNQGATYISAKVSEGVKTAVDTVMDNRLVGRILLSLTNDEEDVEKYFNKTNGELLHDFIEERIARYLKEKFGLTVDDIAKKVLNPWAITARVEGSKLVLGMLGYEIGILMNAENISAMIDVMVSFCTAWMEEIWENLKSFDPSAVPDARDTMKKQTEVIEEQLERLEHLEPIEFRGNQS